MSQITATFPEYTGGDLSRTSNQAEFDASMNYFFEYHKNQFQPTTDAFSSQANALRDEVNILSQTTVAQANIATDAAIVANGLANYKGEYSSGTLYAIGQSVLYNGLYYIVLQNTTGNLPTNTTYWLSSPINSKLDTTIIHNATSKATLDDSDELGLVDSVSSWVLKKLTWGNLKATLANLFVSRVTSIDNAVVRFNGTTGQVQNSGVVIDDGNNIGINMIPDNGLSVKTDALAYGGEDYRSNIIVYDSTTAGAGIGGGIAFGGNYIGTTNKTAFATICTKKDNSSTSEFGASLIFKTRGASTSPLERMRISSSGNLLVGTTTDNGVDTLQVNGSISSGNIKIISNANLNELKYNTENLAVVGTLSNQPSLANEYGYLEVLKYADGWCTQRFAYMGYPTEAYAGRVFVRNLVNNSWTAWV